MKKAIYSFIYYRLLGWKTNVTVPNYDKCVICAAPHTTNFDLFIGKVSVLGIYKGTIKINQLGNTFQYFAELGNIQSQFKRTSEFEEIQESQYPIEQPTYKEFASSGDDSIYHYIDLLAIIQNIHTTK
jgi:hypothetical protein